jgi:hypothetical protein
MRFWIREIAGWGLVLLGLFVFVLVYGLCTHEPDHRYMEAMTMTVIGIFVFRGGVNVLKTAVAARVCQQAQDRLYPAPVPPLRSPLTQRSVVPPAANRSAS